MECQKRLQSEFDRLAPYNHQDAISTTSEWLKVCEVEEQRYRKQVIKAINKRTGNFERNGLGDDSKLTLFLAALASLLTVLAAVSFKAVNLYDGQTSLGEFLCFMSFIFLIVFTGIAALGSIGHGISAASNYREHRQKEKLNTRDIKLPPPCVYDAVLSSSLEHPGGVVRLTKTYPTFDNGQPSQKTVVLGNIVLEEGGIDYTADQFEELLKIIEIREQQENQTRTQVLTDKQMLNSKEAQARIWNEIESVRETNEINASAMDALNAMASDRKAARLQS
jgi:hypothetical protein